MIFTIKNVGTKKRGNKSVELSDSEKQAMVDEWNKNEITQEEEEKEDVREALIQKRIHETAEQSLINEGKISA